jgi:hypothetical protein
VSQPRVGRLALKSWNFPQVGVLPKRLPGQCGNRLPTKGTEGEGGFDKTSSERLSTGIITLSQTLLASVQTFASRFLRSGQHVRIQERL